MTVAVQTSRAVFYGSGSAGPFTFDFPFFDNSWIQAVKSGPTGAADLVQNVDYYVLGAGNPNGGSITTAAALQIGETLYVKREVPLVQQVQFSNFGAFFPTTHEAAFDVAVMQLQQVNDRLTDVQTQVESLPAQQVKVVAAPGSSDVTTVLTADASTGAVEIDITALADVVVTKSDSTANLVTILDSGGNTVEMDPLSTQDETARLKLIGSKWVRL